MSTAATVTDFEPAALARLRAHPMVIPSSAVKVKEVIGHSRYGSVHLGRFKTKLVCLKVSVDDDCVGMCALGYNDTCHGLVTVGCCSDRHLVRFVRCSLYPVAWCHLGTQQTPLALALALLQVSGIAAPLSMQA
jgi:hypothetical protein